MVGKIKSIDHRLLTRRCVSCGYDGQLLRGGQARRCARCGCDLRERPARSYAEMEGLLGQPVTIDAPMLPRHVSDESLIHRWLAFSFLTMLFLGLLGMLLSAAVPI